MKTFLRRLEILKYLNDCYKARLGPVGTEVLVQHLQDTGHADDLSIETKSLFRLIQRDLKFLLGEYDEEDGTYDNVFGLMMERGQGKSLHWSLDPYEQMSYDLEKMPAYMALALSITQKHLTQVLPSSTQKELARVFDTAESRLAKSENKLSPKHYKRLSDSVEFYQRGQSLESPDFDMVALDRIYQAILLGKRLRFTYQSGAQAKEYDVHPYGVTIMLPKVYLIAVKHDLDAVHQEPAFRSFLVHKISDIEVSAYKNNVPEDFRMQRYLAEGKMDVLLDFKDTQSYAMRLQLHAKQDSNLIRDLKDSPIHANQVLTQESSTSWVLEAQVRRTVQLRNWLLALGAQAKVLEPEIIRHDLLQALQEMLKQYDDPLSGS
jgi:predicted DNA-binding transcriptional regulator YafY